MLAALWKGKRFVELGYDAEIRLFENVLDFPVIKAQLIKTGRLAPNLPTTNIHEFLISFVSPALDVQPLYDADAVDKIRDDVPEIDLGYRGISRVRMWCHGGAENYYSEYHRPDGTVYLRGTVRGDRSMMSGAANLETISPAGEITGQFETIRDLWGFWLRYGLSPERPLVVIQDGQFISADGVEVMSTICTGPNDYNISVAHGGTLIDPHEPAATPVSAWADTYRLEKHLDRMVFLTDEQREIWGERFPDQGGLVTIPHECRIDNFEYVERDGDRCVMIASLVEVKRVDHAIRAFSTATLHLPQATLEIYGVGPEEASLLDLISHFGLESRVKLMGYAADAPERLAGSAVSLISSDREAFGMPILESMSRGTPVVSYDIDYGPRYIIRDDVDGYLVPDGDEMMLSERIRQVLADEQTSERLRKAAFDRAQEFSAERVTSQWILTIDRMISAR